MIIEGQRYYATTSIGVALTATAGAPLAVHDLLREADNAMYHAKARGRNGVALFEAGMLCDAEHRLVAPQTNRHIQRRQGSGGILPVCHGASRRSGMPFLQSAR